MKLIKDEVLNRIVLWNGSKIVASMTFPEWTHMLANPDIIKPEEPEVEEADAGDAYLLGLA